ncbi:MAG TPA: phosphoenolpyruvate-utilizing N-terminal domain-containing protein, partial [Bacteroidota bacterium]|nr:phosphoenolpyruvate-utilizing N-terminal domain-containing protein [Bacteroidota bacterium]
MIDYVPSTKKEIILKGLPASPGIAMGSACLYIKDIPRVEEHRIDEGKIEQEIERLRHANEKSIKELSKILAFAQQKVGEGKAKIFEAQIMVLEDQILKKTITDRIRCEKKNAEFIVSDEIGKYANLMLRAHDDYMHERAHDMEDLKNRIIRNMQEE